MDAKQAVQIAKKHVVEIFSEEPIENVGLEEVEFDAIKGVWAITVGFSRFWGHPSDLCAVLIQMRRAPSRLCASMTRAVVSSPSSIAM